MSSWFSTNIVQTGRLPLFCFFCAFVAGFGFIRLSVRLIRAQVRWWPGNVTPGNLHVHHMVFGVMFMLVGGVTGISPPGDSLNWRSGAAALFGLGAALVLDEFALILHLRDVYWTSDGRLSVDAVFVAAGVTVLLLLGVVPSVVPSPADQHASTWEAVISLTVSVGFTFTLAAITLLKGKIWTGLFGLFLPFPLLFIGARSGWPGPVRPGPGGATSAARASGPGRPGGNAGSGSPSSGSRSALRTCCPGCMTSRIRRRRPRRTRDGPRWATNPTQIAAARRSAGPRYAGVAGRARAWVWVTWAARRPPSSVSSVWTTITARPACSGRATAVTTPAVMPRRNTLLELVVAVRAPGGRFRYGADPAQAVGQRHQHAAVQDAAGRAQPR